MQEEEEELDSGTVDAPPSAALTPALLFDESDPAFAAATALPEHLPPAKQGRKVVCGVKRPAAGDSDGALRRVVPPPPPPQRDAPKGLRFVKASSADDDGGVTDGGGGMAAGAGAAHGSLDGGSDSKAMRMMERMGHKSGGGLGRQEQGMTSAPEAHSNVGTLGLGFNLGGGLGAGGTADGDDAPPVAEPLGAEETEPLPVPVWMDACERPPPDAETLREWLVEGARKEEIDDEVEHVDAKVLSSVLRAKSALDHIQDRRAFNDARTRANPFEAIRKEFFLNRAALKMAAMDAAFGALFSGADAADLGAFAAASADAANVVAAEASAGTSYGYPRPAPDLLCFGDVAAGPGGFSEYLLWRRGASSKGFGFTLRGEHDFEPSRFHHRAPPELFHPYYGPRNDGDLYSSENVRAFRDLVSRQTGGHMLHVVMGDGGFDVSGQENIQEVMNKQLLLTQFAAALATLRRGGHFVCKCFDLFTPFSSGMLFLLHTAFDAVCIYKPAQSRPANSERYVVCRGRRDGVEALVDHMLAVNDRLNELKPGWPCGKKLDGVVGAVGGGKADGVGSGGGARGMDVLRLVPAHVLDSPPFGPYLRESNDRLGALQARALVRLIAYMRERGSRICDQSATREECLSAWLLPFDPPPVPAAHPSIEDFFRVQVERGDVIDRRFCCARSSILRPEDLEVASEDCRLRATADWVVIESSANGPPVLVIGADDMSNGNRGLCFFYDAEHGTWQRLAGVVLPSETLLLAEVVVEKLRGDEADGVMVTRVHAFDAAMIAGDDVRRMPYAERRRRLSLLVAALTRDPVAVPQQPAQPMGDTAETANLAGSAVRLKRAFGLHQLAEAATLGRARMAAAEAEADWPTFGLLLFPGHAQVALPLEPAHEWTKQWSNSQQREYYFNGRTQQSIWSSDRKRAPLSFRKCAQALIRWTRLDLHLLPEAKLIELAAAIPPPPAPGSG